MPQSKAFSFELSFDFWARGSGTKSGQLTFSVQRYQFIHFRHADGQHRTIAGIGINMPTTEVPPP